MKTMLILEDDVIMQALYKRLLGKYYVLTVVGTVAEAVRMLGEWRPDVFVSDMRLPDGSGAEAVRFCQAAHPGLPVIVVSGTLEDSEGLEVNLRLAKPFSPTDMLIALQRTA